MALIITPKEQIEDYFNSSAVNQSELKLLIKGLRHYKNNKDVDLMSKEPVKIGSAVDMLLTAGQDQFNEDFHCSNLEKLPSDTEQKIVTIAFNEMINDGVAIEDMGPLGENITYVNIGIQEEDWYKGKPGDKRTQTLIHNCEEFFEDLKAGHGKYILSAEQKLTVDKVVMSLTTNPRTAGYFDKDFIVNDHTMEVYYQLPIYFTYKDVECKALLDIVLVVKDADGKVVVITGYDVKTMGADTLEFESSVYSFRYDFQGAWYNLALRKWAEQKGYSPNAVSDYYKFIVESTTYGDNPLVYTMDASYLEQGENGTEEVKVDGRVIRREVKGYSQMVEEYKWYLETDFENDIRLKDYDKTMNLPLSLNK